MYVDLRQSENTILFPLEVGTSKRLGECKFFPHSIQCLSILKSVPWYLTAELVLQKQRSFVQSIAFTSNTMAGLLTRLLTLPLYGYLDAYAFIPLFIIPSASCLFYLYRQLLETKNKVNLSNHQRA
jgi:hypothetical protein